MALLLQNLALYKKFEVGTIYKHDLQVKATMRQVTTDVRIRIPTNLILSGILSSKMGMAV